MRRDSFISVLENFVYQMTSDLEIRGMIILSLVLILYTEEQLEACINNETHNMFQPP